MLGTAAPIGLLLTSPFSFAIAGVAALLSLWCILRILTASNPLRGQGYAIAGLLAALFWAAVIAGLA
jgi:hypothetical protein